MNADAKLNKVLDPSFKYIKNNNTITDNIDLNSKICNGESLTCKLCNITSNNFNLLVLDPTYTHCKRLWCKDCERWWNTELGYERTMVKKIENLQTQLWKQYPNLWTICYSSHKICLDGTKAQYFYNKHTRESQWTHPINEKKLIKLQEKKQKLIDIINFFLSISN